MITYEEAKKTALERYHSYDTCREYGNAWVFYETGSDAGINNKCAVIKETGKLITFTDYLMEFSFEEIGQSTKIPF